MEKNIRTIEHKGNGGPALEEKKIKRVAAYCRVSTLQEEQDLSFESQCEYFTQLINARDDMVLVGIFGDQGISGLQMQERVQLQEMMELVREDKIDLILVKSISRLARNAIDLQSIIQEAKEHNVVIEFEKEGILSNDPQCELIVKFLASIAQEESNSISQNIQWSIERNNELGHPTQPCPYGYRKKPHKKGEDHVWEIYEPEAEIIRLAFRLALEGEKLSGIAKKLKFEQEKYPDAKQRKWCWRAVRDLLKNEVYIGNLLTNKTYSVDYLTKTRKKNEGERAQFYLKGHHPAIITKQDFKAVNKKISGGVI